MARAAQSRTWYRIALARPDHAPVLVAASGLHLGAAIAAAEHHVAGSWAIAVPAAAASRTSSGLPASSTDPSVMLDSAATS